MSENRFKEQNKELGFAEKTSIIVDKNTGVNYLWHRDGMAGGLTVLVDKNGQPVITK